LDTPQTKEWQIQEKEPRQGERARRPISATRSTNDLIGIELNGLCEMIKVIVYETGALTSTLEKEINTHGDELNYTVSQIIIATKDIESQFIADVQGSQGGIRQPLPYNNASATQALRAAIMKNLADHVLPHGDPPKHPFFSEGAKSQEFKKSFQQWLNGQGSFEGFATTSDRKRQWTAKYIIENIGNDAELKRLRQRLLDEAIRDIKKIINSLYRNSNWHNSLDASIRHLVNSALDVAMKMMGKDSVISAEWVMPGRAYSEWDMVMDDIPKPNDKVALCVAPRWKNSDNFTVSKARVYCL